MTTEIKNREKTIGEEFTDKISRQHKRDKVIQLVPVGILLILYVFFAIVAPGFGSFSNVLTMIGQAGVPLCVALGITFVILIGGIDLSVDGVMAMTGCIVSLLLMNNQNTLNLGILGVIIAVLIGAACGALVGVLNHYAKIPSFMASFALSGVAMGIATASTGAVAPTILDEGFRSLALDTFLGLPYIAWISFGLFVVAYIIQEYTPLGRYMFAIGNNETIPKMTGINIVAVKIFAFAWSGALIGLGGVLYASRLGLGTVLIGNGNLFPAMTAVVLGGTSLSGGKGGVLNTLIGVMIVQELQTGLVLLGVPTAYQQGIQSVIIVIAVAMSVIRGRKVINK